MAKSDEHENDSASQRAEAARPRKKARRKGRKKKRDASSESSAPRRRLRPDGRERPAFIEAFPNHPDVDRLVAAFEAGNYAYIREHAPALLDKSDDADVKSAIRELLRRIEPDPLMRYLLLASIALLVVLSIYAYATHGH